MEKLRKFWGLTLLLRFQPSLDENRIKMLALFFHPKHCAMLKCTVSKLAAVTLEN